MGDHVALQEIEWSGITDVGRFRKENQDAFIALALGEEGVRRLGKSGQSWLTDSDFIFAVSDGMGGAKAGDFASQIAVDKIARLLPRAYRSAKSEAPAVFLRLLSELFESIHEEVAQLGRSYEELSGMGATLSLCWVHLGWVYFGHVGDSRIYHLPSEGGIAQLSEDHTHVGWLRRSGKLSEIQARSHPGRNGLQQVLGGKNQHLSPQFGALEFEAGDRFLLCSDGLVEGLFDSGIDRLIRNPSALATGNPAERLVREAVRTDGKDNTTALCFEL